MSKGGISMKKVLTITLLCIFTSVVLFGAFNAIHSSSADSAKLKKAWDEAEDAIEKANKRMGELRIAKAKYETEQKTLQGDAPSTVLGMIGKGFSLVLNIFFNSAKGVRIIELGALIHYAWVQIDTLNAELSNLAYARDVALAAYNASTSHKEESEQKPDYEEIPTVYVACANRCGVSHSSEDAGGLRYLADYLLTAHRDTCGTSSATPPGCGQGYWTCNGVEKSGTDEHKPRTCKNLGKKWNPTTRKYEVVTCYMSYRECQNTGGKCFDGKVAGKVKHRDNVSSQNSYLEISGGPSETPVKKSVTPGFAPSNGSYTASAGDSHKGIVTAPSIYGAYLYVNGTQKGWFGGTQSITSLSLSYTFPSDASGSYTMKALVYPWKGNTYGTSKSYSYTVTVGSSTTTTSTPSTPSTPSTTDDDDDDDDDDSSTTTSSPYTLSASSTGSPFQAGDTVTLTLSSPVYESYYSVDWSLVSPVYSTSIHLSNDYASGYGSSESSVSYTFPSGYRGITCLKRSFTRMET
jgi:hypothetical protein